MDPTPPPAAAPDEGDQPPLPCDDCRDALDTVSRDSVSFLLLDQFTLPVVGCADHLERFRAVCGLTTDGRAELLSHQPAGGITCPGCRRASHATGHAMIPIDGGAAVLLGCPDHESTIASRYQTGQRTRQRLTDDLDAFRSV
ncbi:hypothetical protein [Haloarcula onubensis]|uniref:Uncharacterized protein n=1 Tax=Haloarcula onubensis TaxID=2950539 RepID=A0ABU2FUX6_9EURY|nr:hypothetical protein [Halomicroarcula sp. S3CR25-11]MDS0284566.1 hypothetical protein [Halomicroarcula sp. S3CR25-11]